MSKKLSREEELNLLVDAGREMGVELMESAIEQSNDSEEMNNQLIVLRVASVHILATSMYNQIIQNKLDANDLLEDVQKLLGQELKMLIETKNEDIEVVKTKNFGKTETKLH